MTDSAGRRGWRPSVRVEVLDDVGNESVEEASEARNVARLPRVHDIGNGFFPRVAHLLHDLATRHRQLEQCCPAVERIRAAIDETALFELLHLPAHGRHVEAEILRQLGQAHRTQLGHSHEHAVTGAIDFGSRALADRLGEAWGARESQQRAECLFDLPDRPRCRTFFSSHCDPCYWSLFACYN